MKKIAFGIFVGVIVSSLVFGILHRNQIQSNNTEQLIEFAKGWDAYENKDYVEAFSKFLPLAQNGHAESQYWIGFMYEQGRGIPVSTKESKKWLHLAGKNGFGLAYWRLGYDYENYNMEKAIEYYYLAVEAGDGFTAHSLGKHFYYGWDGVEKDYDEAMRLFQIAIDNGLNIDIDYYKKK